MDNNILNEELGRMKSLFGYEKGKVISEQAITPGLNTSLPMFSQQTIANQTPVPQQSANQISLYGQQKPIVDCTGISKFPMDTPTAAQQQDFMQKSGLNPNTSTNKEFYCSLQKMSAKLRETQNTQKPKLSAPSPTPAELKDVNGIKKFQDWLDENKKGWATGYQGGVLSKSGKGYGRMGPRTNKAWGLYKSEFLNPQAPIKPITQQEIATINAVDRPKTAVTTPTNITAPTAKNLTPSKTPEQYYQELVSLKLIDPVGGNRIVYRGQEPSADVLNAINTYLNTQGYTQTRTRTPDGKDKLVAVWKK